MRIEPLTRLPGAALALLLHHSAWQTGRWRFYVADVGLLWWPTAPTVTHDWDSHRPWRVHWDRQRTQTCWGGAQNAVFISRFRCSFWGNPRSFSGEPPQHPWTGLSNALNGHALGCAITQRRHAARFAKAALPVGSMPPFRALFCVFTRRPAPQKRFSVKTACATQRRGPRDPRGSGEPTHGTRSAPR